MYINKEPKTSIFSDSLDLAAENLGTKLHVTIIF